MDIYEAPFPRMDWMWNHHRPHPLYIMDMTRNRAFKFHLPPIELDWSKESRWEVVPIANSKTRPIEYSGGDPYKIKISVDLIHEFEWPKIPYNTFDKEQDWAAIEKNAKDYLEYTSSGGGNNFGMSDPNTLEIREGWSRQRQTAQQRIEGVTVYRSNKLHDFIIELKKLHSNPLRIVVAASYFTDAYGIQPKDLQNLDTGTTKAEGYNVVLVTQSFKTMMRDEVLNFPTYVKCDMEFLQR